jgi:hypothetical protein
MIVKPITVHSYAYNTVAYLFGPGRTNEHTDQHLVAAWSDHAPDPGRHPEQHTVGKLAARLDVPLKALRPNQRPDAKYLHIPIRTAAEDRQLTDSEWAVVARRVLAAGGLLTHSEDRQGPRWIAVRHAPDHIHLLVGLIRQDGRAPDLPKMYIKAMRREVDRIEADLGLRQLNPGDGTAAKHPGHQEYFKAARQQQPAESIRLRTTVRQALAASATVKQLVTNLAGHGVLANVTLKPSGDIRGITFAHQPDHGQEPVWYSGSRLAPDLSLPKILERIRAAHHFTNGRQGDSPWHQAALAVSALPGHLDHGDDQQAADDIHALGALLDATAQAGPAVSQVELRHAAIAFERATRFTKEADYQAGRALREVAWQLTRHHAQGDIALELLCLLVTVMAAVARWHQSHQHRQQQGAAQQTLTHLRTAYQQAASAPLTQLSARTPDSNTCRRYEQYVRTTLPDHAEQVLASPNWAALAATLHYAAQAGLDPRTLLTDEQELLARADDPAAHLIWRTTAEATATLQARASAATTRTTQPLHTGPGQTAPHSANAPNTGGIRRR